MLQSGLSRGQTAPAKVSVLDRSLRSQIMNVLDYRCEFGDFNSSLELGRYKQHAGLDTEPCARSLYDRHSGLFTLEAIRDLESCLDASPEDFETERSGVRTLLGAARLGYVELQALQTTEELARYEWSTAVSWEGEEIPLPAIPTRLAREQRDARRHQLYERWLEVVSAWDDLRAQRFGLLRRSAQALGFDSLNALYADISGVSEDRLERAAKSFLESTGPLYTSILASTVARGEPNVSLAQLHYSDFYYLETMPQVSGFFREEDLMVSYAQTMSGLGIHVAEQQNIVIDTETRKKKKTGDACFAVHPPDDVRLVVASPEGVSAYSNFWHEAGRAQCYAWCSQELASKHPEFVYSPDAATTQGYGSLFSSLLIECDWLAEFLPGVSQSRAREIASGVAFLALSRVRRWCAKLSYEILLHNADDVRSEQMRSTYKELQGQATGSRTSPTPYLFDVEVRPMSASLLRAAAFGAGLGEYLRTRYGYRWWTSRKAGDELRDLWNTGSRYSVEELARRVGFDEISFDLLSEKLIAAVDGV